MRTVILWSRHWPWVSIKNSRSNYPLRRRARAKKPADPLHDILIEAKALEEKEQAEQQVLPLETAPESSTRPV